MVVLELEPEQLGRMVALEGDSETIDTQLRLLPPSQKILILPALHDTLPQESDNDTFSARTFVQKVHTAFTERSETARAFLRSSTSAQPRIVFVNGGSVNARASCITRIHANITNGNIEEAEEIFNEIVKDGVAGLMRPDVTPEEDKEQVIEDDDNAKVGEGNEDPCARAMKAAESLDRETQALQPDTPVQEQGLSAVETPVEARTMAIPYSVFNGSTKKRSQIPINNNSPRRAVFTSQKNDDIVRTVLTVPSRNRRFTVEEKRSTFGTYSYSTPNSASTLSPVKSSEEIEQDDSEDDDLDIISPGESSMFSAPPTPAVVYEEAYLVDVQSQSGTATPKRTMKRAQSFDQFNPSIPGVPGTKFLNATSLKHAASDHQLGRSRPPHALDSRFSTLATLPRTTFVKASQTTIKKSPTLGPSTRSNSSSSQGASPRIYVERGADAIEVPAEELEEPFEPVFPLLEDLVIHLVDDNSNDILESVLRSYKDGTYPIMAPAVSGAIKDGPGSVPPSPTTATTEDKVKILRPESYLTAETDDQGYERRHEYDPYADHDSYPPEVKRQWPPLEKTSRIDSLNSTIGPLTPTTTPPPTANGASEKFLEFAPSDSHDVINVQDSLRQLLSTQFPTGENCYTQYLYPVAPEADRLWRPVFRNNQNTSIGNDGKNMDQIIALGCEDGVKKDFFFQISGQVERLGTKRDGINRSGKVDVRYMISNVMQIFGSSQDSPSLLSNHKVLATLLVPQIEAYLATNTSTRLLILQYPAAHLPTILALRDLLGSDTLKIAGVLDSLASDPPSMGRSPSHNPLSNEAVTQRAQSHSRLSSLQRTRPDSARAESSTLQHQSSITGSSISKPSFSKADFLLPSIATDSEITTFLSSIWKCLMEKSTFYTPEPEPKPIIVERPPMPPTPTATTRESRRHHEREREDSDGPVITSHRHGNAGSQSKIARLTGGAITGPSTARSTYTTPSIISTTTTNTARPSRTHRSTRSQHNVDPQNDYEPSIASTRHKYAASIASTKTTASEKERRRDREWENFYIGDEDSEDDAYDKMIMGRQGSRIVPREEVKVVQKRGTKKALKWLGLA